jgi:hypothetical protein
LAYGLHLILPLDYAFRENGMGACDVIGREVAMEAYVM